MRVTNHFPWKLDLMTVHFRPPPVSVDPSVVKIKLIYKHNKSFLGDLGPTLRQSIVRELAARNFFLAKTFNFKMSLLTDQHGKDFH